MNHIIALCLSVLMTTHPAPGIKLEEAKLPTAEPVQSVVSYIQVQPLVQRAELPPKQAPVPYTDEDLYILSHVINGEAGSDWISDEEQLLVGNVVMNRVASDKFPNTIHDVVFQEGQYACTWDGNYEKTPTPRAVENAKKVLQGERFCPENVLYQSTSIQGDGVYKQVDSTYFCYG